MILGGAEIKMPLVSAAFELVAAGRRGNSIGAFWLLQRRIGIRLDANVHRRSLFKTHILTVLVSQGVLDANLAIKIVRSFNVDLCLFRLARNNWLDDFVDGAVQLLPFLAHGPSPGKAYLGEAFYQRAGLCVLALFGHLAHLRHRLALHDKRLQRKAGTSAP